LSNTGLVEIFAARRLAVDLTVDFVKFLLEIRKLLFAFGTDACEACDLLIGGILS
jgi:hypothetical protein